MNSTLPLKSLIISFSMIISLSLNAQKNDDDLVNLQTVLFLTQNNPKTYFFDGKINLNNNDSLIGQISVNHKKNGEYSTIFRHNDSCTFVPNKTIKAVTLFEQDRKSETKFRFINDSNKLYREIFYNEKKNISVYDTSDKPFNDKLIAEVFVKENDTIINTFDFWTSGPKKDLINYLRKRDGIKYKRRDFDSLQDLFETL